MQRKELVEILSNKLSTRLTDMPAKDVDLIVSELFETIKQQIIKGEVIELRGFGTFYTKHRNEKTARNPKTGERVHVDSRKVPYFKAGSIFRKQVISGTYFKLTKKRSPQ